MGASMMPPPPKASEQLVRDVMRATFEMLAEDGHDWMALVLRKHGWTVTAPATERGGK